MISSLRLFTVDAIIHLASLIPGRASPADLCASLIAHNFRIYGDGALEDSCGRNDECCCAKREGMRREFVTSSIVTVTNPKESYTDQDWNPTTKEEALNGGNDVVNYSTSNKFTEIAI
ncbi:hypothetical protein B0H13DRAFT_1876844 [Mycena leptocephala]|nr:hypothetical protein B0H13DRAFT_1876844 [Mycena leptocephala]